MIKILQRITSIILVLTLIAGNGLTVFAETANDPLNPIETVSETDIIGSGKCGENLTWELTKDGTLTVSGIGDMRDAPWSNYRTSIKKLILEEGITSICDEAFYCCSNLAGALEIPEGVTSIGKSAFFECAGLTGALVLPQSVTKIGSSAFLGCSGLTGELVIPEGVTSIGTLAFGNCKNFIGTLKIPEGITSIGTGVFLECRGLSGELVIHEGVTSIANNAFTDCDGIDQVTILNSECVINSLPDYAEIVGYNNSTAHEYAKINDKKFICIDHSYDGGIVTTEPTTTTEGTRTFTCAVCGETKRENIPVVEENLLASGECGKNSAWELTKDGTLTISGTGDISKRSWDSYHTSIKKIVIEEGITSIVGWAFYDYSSLTGELVLPEGLVNIGEYAFTNCSGLTGNLVIPDSVTNIGNAAFSRCSGITGKLVLPKGITSIGNDTFYRCSGLTGELVIPESVTNIGIYAFFGCSSLNGNLVIPENVTNIGQGAFYDCTGLTGELVIPESVVSIGEDAFAKCTQIGKITILNRECEIRDIYDAYSSLPDNADIVGYGYSTAYEYAKLKGKKFICFEHSWNAEYTVDKEATCTEEGSKSIHCGCCSATKDETVIKAAGHRYGEWIVDVGANCTTKGSQYKECANCESVVREEIPVKDHSWNAEYTVDKEATCTETGSKSIHCVNCDATKDEAVIKAAGHSYGNWIIVMEADCENEGLQYKTCSVCKEPVMEKIAATGHSYGEYKTTQKATFGKDGKQTATCTKCEIKKTKKIPAVNTPTLSTTTYTFNNKAKNPSVTVKDSTGAKLIKVSSTSKNGYKVTYASGRKSVGKYTVKVTLTGADYSGTKTVYFKINPKGSAISSLSKDTKAFIVKWKKQSSTYREQITGYQIRYSTSSKMTSSKTVTIKSKTATSKKISNLKAKKTYYVQLRTYKTIGSTKYYSGWSTAKKVTTK